MLPCEPAGPLGPEGPGTVEAAPVGRSEPCAPAAPVGPVGPATVEAAPVGPVGPCAPAAPVGPIGPATVEAAASWAGRALCARCAGRADRASRDLAAQPGHSLRIRPQCVRHAGDTLGRLQGLERPTCTAAEPDAQIGVRLGKSCLSQGLRHAGQRRIAQRTSKSPLLTVNATAVPGSPLAVPSLLQKLAPPPVPAPTMANLK